MASVSRRQCLTATASLVGGLLAAACDIGGSQTPQEGESSPPTPRPLPKPAEAPAATKQSVTLQVFTGLGLSAMHQGFWHRGGPKDAFESKHPHIKVEWQRLSRTPAGKPPSEAFSALIASDDPIDVVQFPSGWTGLAVAQGGLLALDQLIARDHYDLTDYWPGLLAASRWRGALYALATNAVPFPLLCNATLFADAGLTVPPGGWSWEQFLAAARTLAIPPVYGFVFPFNSHLPLTLSWIRGNGGDMLSDDLGRSLVNRAAAQEAVQWLADLVHIHTVTQTADEAASGRQINALWKAGRVAMVHQGWLPEASRRRSAPTGEVAYAELPRGPVHPASYMAIPFGAWYISSASSVTDEAWAFLMWWTSAEVQRDYHAFGHDQSYVALLTPPARQAVASEFEQRYGRVTLASLAHGQSVPLHPALPALLVAFQQGLAPVFTGQQSVAEATAAVTQEQDNILAQWAP